MILKNHKRSIDIDDQQFGMSSYCKYFFGIEKYKFGAFQRRIGRHRVTSGHDFRHLYEAPHKRLMHVVKRAPGRRIARYHAIRQSHVTRFMDLVILGTFFTYSNISEPPDKF